MIGAARYIRDRWESVKMQVDWPLLFYLLLVCNYRFVFKIIALAGFFWFNRSFKIKWNGITIFYASMIILSIVSGILMHFSEGIPRYGITITACLLWAGCFFSIHHVSSRISSVPSQKLINTVKSIAIINVVASFLDYALMVKNTGFFNPYSALLGPPYGISSGDLIGGVFGGMHLVNTIVSAFLLIFFIRYSGFFYVIISLIPFLLTCSNLSSLLVTGILIVMIFTLKDNARRNYALFCLPLVFLFYSLVTPENGMYVARTVDKALGKKKHDSLAYNVVVNKEHLAAERRKREKEAQIFAYVAWHNKMHPDEAVLDKATSTYGKVLSEVSKFEVGKKQRDIHSEDYIFFKKDSLMKAKSNSAFFEYGKLRRFDFDHQSGKIISFRQTYQYLAADPVAMAFGSGPGGFSSRLAFISSGIVDDSRILKLAPKFETEAFRENHKAIFKFLMFQDDSAHSITNLPFSWYNQAAGEYGLLGVLAFILFYLTFFIRRVWRGRITWLLLPLMLVFFLFDYWFERLSVMIMFEFIMLLDMKLKSEGFERHGADARL